jgi:hypothetical protein
MMRAAPDAVSLADAMLGRATDTIQGGKRSEARKAIRGGYGRETRGLRSDPEASFVLGVLVSRGRLELPTN